MKKEFPTPKVGERVVSVSMFNLGKKGTREKGFSDPLKKMAWVKWDDSSYSGEFLKSLIREKDYPKTWLYTKLAKKVV